jgi:hypothetical protein
MKSTVGTILAPDLPQHLPPHCQWLSGQGAGVWFCIDKTDIPIQYIVQRFSPEGNLDCKGIFEIEQQTIAFDILKPYQFTHISHCAKCRIAQNEIVFVFNSL